MQVDFQNFVLFLLGVVAAMGAWVVKQIWGAVVNLRLDMSAMERELPRSYVAKSDFSDAMKEVRDGLTRIYDKLDGKADKP